MFLCVGVLYDRMHSRQIGDYGGVVNTMPQFASFMMLFAMANAGLPATSGFVGEFMVILSAVKVSFWLGFLAALTLILGAAYTLWMVKRVIFGAVANANVAALTDIGSPRVLAARLCRGAGALAGVVAQALRRRACTPRSPICWRTSPRASSERRRLVPSMPIDLLIVLPELVLLCGATLVLLVDLVLADARRHVTFWLAQATLLLCVLATLATAQVNPVWAFHGLVVERPGRRHAQVLQRHRRRADALLRAGLPGGERGLFRGETFVLTLFALLGMMVMISASSFLTLYLGLELHVALAVRAGGHAPRPPTAPPRRR